MEQSEATLLKKIELLTTISTALSAERDTEHLLERILLGAKELTGADGGSLYVVKDRQLIFALVHTTSLGLHMGGTSGTAINFPPLSLDEPDGEPNRRMVVTRAVNEDSIFNIPDAYNDHDFDFAGTRAFDARTGYRSQSLLAVPMKDHEQQIIGVLQLINATDAVSGRVGPFSAADARLVAALSSQAAVALNRKQLIEGLENLLKALTHLIANTIDEKSASTGNHCRRVPPITMALALAVNADDGHYAQVCFDANELAELEMAAWLHDCGKLTTPDRVMDKRTKLETLFDRIALIDARLEILQLQAELAGQRGGADAPERALAVYTPETIADIRAFLHRCNQGGEFMAAPDQQRLAEIGAILLADDSGQKRHLLLEDEIANLAIPRGTLTDEERDRINNHALVSARMLSTLPFPKHLARVPLIAGGHHERMNGSGYPNHIPAAQLPLQARILAIADVFEALTASDRLYRKANTLSVALTIMARMGADGHLDCDLLELFVRRQVYAAYAQEFCQPEQIDLVDEAAILTILAKGRPVAAA